MQKIDEELKEKGYKSLSWANGWGNHSPEEFVKCRDSNHVTHEIQHTRSGSDNTVWCDECKISWKYDCSG